MQGTQVWEDPTYLRASKPVSTLGSSHSDPTEADTQLESPGAATKSS